MGRRYAGILGSIAFGTVLFRGLLHGGSVEATLQVACVCMFVFAAVGAVVGQIAASVVEEAVRFKFVAELQAHDQRPSSS